MSSKVPQVYHHTDEQLAEWGHELRKIVEQELVLKRRRTELERLMTDHLAHLPPLYEKDVDKKQQNAFFMAFNAVMAGNDPVQLRTMFEFVSEHNLEMRAWRSEYGETLQVAYQRRIQELGGLAALEPVIAAEAAAVKRWSIIACGDRNWPFADRAIIRKRFAQLPDTTRLIHGANGTHDRAGKLVKGADLICAHVAKQLGWPPPKAFPYIGSLGAAGGPVRNTQMLDELLRRRDRDGDEIAVIAFHRDFANSKGTLNMVDQARKREVPFELVIT